jgi:predicted esterase
MFLAIVFLINAFLMAFLVSTNRAPTHDEARGIAAGVAHWHEGRFNLADDSPPLARMVSVLPLLPLGLSSEWAAFERGRPEAGSDVLDRELRYAGRFAHINPYIFNLYCLARMMGCVWWLLGAWVLFRWSGRFHGGVAGTLAVILWSLLPIVLEQEQLATSVLPAAVIGAAATYFFWDYLRSPSWDKALGAGLLLGIAQLVDFASLGLLIIWPLMAIAYRLTAGVAAVPAINRRTWTCQAAAAIALAAWTVNSGYGFAGTGAQLGDLNLSGPALPVDPRPPGELPASAVTGGRPRGTWLGWIVVPLPACYIEGLGRRWRGPEPAPQHRRAARKVEEVGGDSLSPVRGKLPMGLWVMILGGIAVAAGRSSRRAPMADEFILLIPALSFLALGAAPVGVFSPAAANLMAIPFLVVLACGIGSSAKPARQGRVWVAVALSGWAIGEGMITSHRQFFSTERTALFRQDLVRQGRRLGLGLPEQGTLVGQGADARGLFYRTFVDSRGDEVNYALFVPKSYRGDRPFPLILLLHGWGDRGTTAANHRYTEVGLPFTLKYREIDFLVLCPQGRDGTWEADGGDTNRAMELLASIQQEYRVDPGRISLTGISSGGTGVWNIASRFPDRWAAIVPVAGAGEPAQAPAVKHIPCWCFHNRYDGDILADQPRKMMESLRALGGNPIYTEYLDTGHRAWERAYVLPELYDWLARQRLPGGRVDLPPERIRR